MLFGQKTHAAVDVAAIVVEYVPDTQSVQDALPVALLYFPATHATHGPPLGPVYPALQGVRMHAAIDGLALGEVMLAGHAVQFALPVVFLYVPATHIKQPIGGVML